MHQSNLLLSNDLNLNINFPYWSISIFECTLAFHCRAAGTYRDVGTSPHQILAVTMTLFKDLLVLIQTDERLHPPHRLVPSKILTFRRPCIVVEGIWKKSKFLLLWHLDWVRPFGQTKIIKLKCRYQWTMKCILSLRSRIPYYWGYRAKRIAYFHTTDSGGQDAINFYEIRKIKHAL